MIKIIKADTESYPTDGKCVFLVEPRNKFYKGKRYQEIRINGQTVEYCHGFFWPEFLK